MVRCPQVGQNQPYRAPPLLLSPLILIYGFTLFLAGLVSLVIKHLSDRSPLLSKLALKALNHIQDTLT